MRIFRFWLALLICVSCAVRSHSQEQPAPGAAMGAAATPDAAPLPIFDPERPNPYSPEGYNQMTALGVVVQQSARGLQVTNIYSTSPLVGQIQVGDIIYAVSIGLTTATPIQTVEGLQTSIVSFNANRASNEIFIYVRRGPADNESFHTATLSRAQVASSLLLPSIQNGYRSTPAQRRPVASTGDYRWVGKQAGKTEYVPIYDPSYVWPNAAIEQKKNYARVKVFFGTDRKLVNKRFSGERDVSDQPLQLGWCYVSIPRGHQIGGLESPTFLRRWNPAKHVVVLKIRVQTRDNFGESINSLLEKSVKKRVMIFVHGYNTSFVDAARRTAQLHFDLKFDGISTFFSWPSNGKTASYVADESDSRWAIPHFTEFVELVCNQTDADSVFVIAHSMGNRIVTQSLLTLIEKQNHGKIKEVILAAPDVDSEIFDRFAPKLNQAFERITIYASSNDRALLASRKIHEIPRAGEIINEKPTINLLDNLDVIDVSVIDTSLVGHTYYGDRVSIIADIFNLVKHGHSVNNRFGLSAIPLGTGKYFWRFIPMSK